jgi:hypothetical protein
MAVEAFSAQQHILLAGDDIAKLWDLGHEMAEIYDEARGHNPNRSSFAVHSLPEPEIRFCFHPAADPGVEIRSADFLDGLRRAVGWLAREMPSGHTWVRA